jgi:hypothetical protein
MFEDYRLTFRTDDYGKSWTLMMASTAFPGSRRASSGDPDWNSSTRNERCTFFDDGAHWQSLQRIFPVGITDLRVHTRTWCFRPSRGFWILDDVTPLHDLGRSAECAATCSPARYLRMRMAMGTSAAWRRGESAGWCRSSLSPRPLGSHPGALSPEEADSIYSSERASLTSRDLHGSAVRLTKKAGRNCFVWDLRHPVVDIVPDAIVWGFTGGPAPSPTAAAWAGDWNGGPDSPIRASRQPGTSMICFMLEARSSLDETYDGVRRART